MAMFPIFFFGNLGQENVFYDILERRSVFLGYENKKFKKPKNLDFSQGVNPWFSPKYGFFFSFFRSAYTALGLGIRCLRHTKQQVNSSGSYFGWNHRSY